MKSLSSGTPRARLLSQARSFHLDAHTCAALGQVTSLRFVCLQSPAVSMASS